MSEYIKKEDAIGAVMGIFRVSALFSGMDDSEKIWREKAEKILAKPSIDIVRCSECIRANTRECSHSYWDDDWGEWRIGYKGDDWFCADGERMQVMYYPQVDGITPSVIGNCSEKPNNSNERSRVMLKRLAYKIVYNDLTKPSGCGLFVGKHDARNGDMSFVNGIWTLMEYIAYEVSEKNGDKFNELFFDNLEKSEQEAKSRYGLQTERSSE